MLIDHINLSRFDLNLLVALDALLTDRSVTRAAARVGLRQSAMSHNLARLRALLGDELLTPAPPSGRSGLDCPTAPRYCSVRHCFPISARAHRASGCVCRPPIGCSMSSTPTA